jgi:hypothetical protein
LEVNAVGQQKTPISPQMTSKDHNYSSCASLLIPLNIGKPHLVLSSDRKAVLVSLERADICWCGGFSKSTLG